MSKMTKISRGKLYFVSNYRDELDEIYDILEKDFPYKLEYKRAPLEEVQGDADTVVRNKCIEAAKLYGVPVIVEDKTLSFDAFAGLPGPYTKYFLLMVGPEGLFRMLKDWDNKGAVAACRIAYCESPTSEPVIFKGLVKGTIVKPRGSTGSGFDACFKPIDAFRTYGQIDPYTRVKMSYRYLAVKELVEYFKNKK